MNLAYFAAAFVRNVHVENLQHTTFPSQKKRTSNPPRASTLLPVMINVGPGFIKNPVAVMPGNKGPPTKPGLIPIQVQHSGPAQTFNTNGPRTAKGPGAITSWLGGGGGITGTQGMPSAAQGIKDLQAYIPYLQGVASGAVSVAPDSDTVTGALANISSAITTMASNIPELVTLAGGVNSAYKAQIRNLWAMVNPNDGGKALAGLLGGNVDGSGATVDAVNTALNAATALQQNLQNVNMAVTGNLGPSEGAWKQAYGAVQNGWNTIETNLSNILQAIATANASSGANSQAASQAAANIQIAQALLAFAQAHADKQAVQMETVMAKATNDAASAFGAIDASDWAVATSAVAKLNSDVNQAGSLQQTWDPNWVNVSDLAYGGPGTTYTGNFGDVIFQATGSLAGTLALMQAAVTDIQNAANDVSTFQGVITASQPMDKAALAALAAANAVVTLANQGITQVQSGNMNAANNTLTQAQNTLASIQAQPFQGFGEYGDPPVIGSTFTSSQTMGTGAYQSPGTPTTTTLATNQQNATTAIGAAQSAIAALQAAIANPSSVQTTNTACGPGYQMDPAGSGQCVPVSTTYTNPGGGYTPPPITPVTTNQAGNSSLSAAGNEVAAADQAALQVLQTSDPTQAAQLLAQATQLSAQANSDYSNAQMDPTSDPNTLALVGNALTQLASDITNAQNYVAQLPAPVQVTPQTPAPSSGTPWGMIALAAAGLLGGYAVYRSSK